MGLEILVCFKKCMTDMIESHIFLILTWMDLKTYGSLPIFTSRGMTTYFIMIPPSTGGFLKFRI